jgi:HD-like signal output (HDOD) protein
MDLKSLLDHPGKLPTIPRVTQRVIHSFNSDNVTAAEIAELIETDPVLSAKLLSLANSAYFQVARSIERWTTPSASWAWPWCANWCSAAAW